MLITVYIGFVYGFESAIGDAMDEVAPLLFAFVALSFTHT